MKNQCLIAIFSLATLTLAPALYAHPGHGDHGIMHYGLLKIVIGGLVLTAIAVVSAILVRQRIRRVNKAHEAALLSNSK